MKENARRLNKFEYYLEDCDCRLCLYYKGVKRGCKYNGDCPFEDIKQTAIKNNRIKRKKSINRSDLK